MTGRTFSGTTATLSYDLLDHLTKWLVSSSNKELYVYDASGNRVLRRTTNSSSTTMIVYAFGLEEHTYGGAGAHQSDTYYYSLAGRLLGSLDGNGTQFYLTDGLGSVLASFSNAAGGAAIKANQVFGPYGTARYSAGTLNTAKGFTGQYNDALTGLDYYNARYYDPVVGVFLSTDTANGNMAGMNPYAYVNGNPETQSDPSGRMFAPFGGGGGPIVSPPTLPWNAVQPSTLPAGGIPPAVQPSSPPSGGTAPALVPLNPFAIHPTVARTSPSNGSQGGGLSSCGTPGPSQPSCGIFQANFAVYLSTGGEIGLPGPWCVWCGSGGGFNESGEAGSGNDLTSVLASDTEGEVLGDAGGGSASGDLDASLAEGRAAWGMKPRSLNPDELQTLAKLFVDGDEYWGVNGKKPISFPINFTSSSHAEIDALDQLARDREITGISGGDALMLVDRMPCPACNLRGGIRSGVIAARLDSLLIYYGASFDKYGNFFPPGVLEVLGGGFNLGE